MNRDYKRQTQKNKELQDELSCLLISNGVDAKDSEIISAKLLKSITQVTPPQEEARYTQLITASSFSGAGGGTCSKAGNILLNLNQLFGGLASGALVFSGATGSVEPWALVAATIAFWISIRGITRVNVKENDIAVLWVMWQLKNSDKIVYQSEQEILIATNNHLKKYGKNSIGPADVKAALNNLQEIKSIKPSAKGGWIVVECVSVSYR